MTRHPATPFLARLSAEPDLAIGVVSIDVAIAAAAGQTVPEWIKISPRGELRCRDGRVFTLEPEAIVARFSADKTDVAVDIGHATVNDHTAGAVAWLAELQARPDGLYGRPDWLDAGKAILAARSHRYVSPAFRHDADGRATWLHSVALVAAPALSNMPALASAQPAHQEPTMKELTTLLGLQQTASETAILAAISAGFVKKDVHEATLAQLTAASTELATLKAEGRKGEIDRALDDALKAKKIVPAEREHYAKLCATDDGFSAVKGLLSAMTPKIAPSGLDTRQVETGASGKDAATLAADARKVATERGIPLSDAMSIVTRKAA